MRTVLGLAGTAILVVALAFPSAAQTCPELTGCWEGTYNNTNTSSVAAAFDLELEQTGDQLSGSEIIHGNGLFLFGSTIVGSVSGSFTCDALEFTTSEPPPGAVSGDHSGQVTDDCMSGTASFFIFSFPAFSGTFDACRVACCGNGIVNTGETCDDADASAGDGCSDTCLVEPGFTCLGTPSDCRPIGCGNGYLESGEQCDDGNTAAGDCCQPDCSLAPPGTNCAAPPFPVGVCLNDGTCLGIPTLSEWGVMLMSTLMLGAVLRRRRRGLALLQR
jgi:cysteine-rich repeat protein